MNPEPVLDPAAWLVRHAPDAPVFLFDPPALAAQARRFLTGFPGTVTYAVKANPYPRVLEVLWACGLGTFDVASPAEMRAVRAVAPEARLHYHNPVRSRDEIAEARRHGMASWSVDRMGELDKLGALDGAEIAVRLKLPVAGAAYDFGAKFGATPDAAAALLRAVAARGGRPALTFHPGTQCEGAGVWAPYIEAAAAVARAADVHLARLNVGGGFPARRGEAAISLGRHFDAIATAARRAFDTPPPLVCEPGRALAAEAMHLGLRVKAVDGDTVFLNDGLYGGLAEWRDIGPACRIRVLSPDGTERRGPAAPRTVFGPTCDSLDRLPDGVALPGDLAEGDHVLISGMGAYSLALSTGFNGYGAGRVIDLAHAAQAGRRGVMV